VRALVFTEPGRVGWQELPDPRPEPRGAVVRPLAVARCDLDPAMAAFGLFPGPYPVGHERDHRLLPAPDGLDDVALAMLPDNVVDATAEPAGVVCAIRSTADAGVLTLVGIVFGDAPLPLLEMYSRGITLHASRADSRRHLPAVLELASSGAFDPRAVPTTVVPFDDAVEAWLAPATKLVLVR
jgi:D-arabinose 1-dehydrogenase-like Zn-dependent alcohol dehydrogenase